MLHSMRHIFIDEHKPFKPPTRPTCHKQVFLDGIEQKMAQLTCRNDNFRSR